MAVTFGFLMFSLGAEMVADRSRLEPMVRLLHPFMLGQTGYRYEQDFYVLYASLVVALGAIPFATLAFGALMKKRTDRRIDRYLAARLPRHERQQMDSQD